MTSDPTAIILNVGHGNAALIRDGQCSILVDTGGSQAGLKVLEFLRSEGITEISALLLSHADEDHIGSAPTILLAPDISIKQVFLNSDSSKRTKAFDELRQALKVSRKEKNTQVVLSLTTSQTGAIPKNILSVEVLYPPPELAASGPGGTDLLDKTVTTNSMSAVMRFSHPNGASIILPADCDEGALNFWTEEDVSVATEILVFPHHGGRPGGFDPGKFASRFTRMATPQYVIFSIHVSKHSLPRGDVLSAIQHEAPEARLACTQLPESLRLLCKEHPWTLHQEAIYQSSVRINLSLGEVSLSAETA